MKIINKKAKFNYEFLEKFEAGIILEGREVKSIRLGQIKLDESFVQLDNQGAWLVNCHISPYKFANNQDYNPTRRRKLLLHKQEILALDKKMEGKNLTIVPVSCYTSRHKIKLELALARGKKKWDKREKIRKRDLAREQARELKSVS